MPVSISPSTYYGEPLYGRKRAVLSKQGLRVNYDTQLLDHNNAPLDIDALKAEHSLADVVCKISFREATLIQPEVIIDNATITDASQAMVRFSLPTEVMKVPAIYQAELALFAPDDESVFYANNRFYVYNEPTNWTDTTYTLFTVDDLRLSLRDSDAIENELIANYDFDLAELCYAVVRAVQYWNETPPLLQYYTTSHFPFRNMWLTGIQLFLFEMIEEHYRRNYLPHSLGGLTTDDKNKMQLYRAAWNDRFQRFSVAVKQQKIRMNAELGTGTVGGFYSYYSTFA